MSLTPLFIGAFESRAELFGLPDEGCFRLFNASGDGLDGLTVDLYGEYLLAQMYFDETCARAQEIIRAMEPAIARLPRSPLALLVKDRRKLNDGDGFALRRTSETVWGDAPPPQYRVRHAGTTVLVDLLHGQHTGLFLDMREIRGKLRPFYGGAGRFLNLFSYTGIFSVHALLNGALSAVNVDLSAAVLERARRNYRANGLECDDRDFVRGDSFEWLRRFGKKDRLFDMVIFDPPTFSRNRRRSFSVKRDYRAALEAIRSCAPGGMALTTINAESVTEREYRSFHPAGWEPIFYSNESSDFVYKIRPYLKAGLWRIPG